MLDTKKNWNLTADWERGHHSAAMVIYYVDSYKTGRAVPASAQAFGFNSGIGNRRTIDLSYNFNLGDTRAVFTLGGKSVFDKEAPCVYDEVNFSYDPEHHDPRGRMLFARVTFAL